MASGERVLTRDRSYFEHGDDWTDEALREVIAMPQTPWQRVIHGGTQSFRQVVALGMIEAGQKNIAQRYICCGMGDSMGHVDGDGYRVKPVRCGHKLCPRCGRYRGSQRARHVLEHLERGPHGSLWHMVFTQRVHAGESLKVTRARFEDLWKRLARRFEACGIAAALRTTHCAWARGGGWHYHAHVFFEHAQMGADAEQDIADLRAYWTQLGRERQATDFDEGFTRMVADAGAGLPVDEEAQGEFWADHRSDIARAIQYVVHDVCQGVEAWNLTEKQGCAAELAAVLKGAQLSRLYGLWKQSADKRFGPPERTDVEPATVEVKAFDARTVVLGTMDEMLRSARQGVRSAAEACQWLMDRTSSVSMVGRRLRKELKFLGG